MELLQQVRIIDPVQQVDRLADVLIVNDQIEQISEQITDYPEQVAIIQPAGLVLGTGLVDLYSHSGEPGNETRETLSQLAQGAAMGGFTEVGILPDTIPAMNSAEVIAAVKQKSNFISVDDQQQISLPKLNFWGSTSDRSNQTMNPLGEIAPEVIGFIGSHNLSNLSLLPQVLEYIQPWEKTLAIALHSNELAGNGVVRKGGASLRYGMVGSPSFSEAAMIAAILEMVAETPTNLHFMRVSTRRGVELIADAKARGVKVTASTTWMHLLGDSNHIASYDPNLRLEPPLGNPSDQEALIQGVRQGIIDAIAIDHQAYTYEEKTVAFALAPPGVIGLELALPLLWQRFVATGEWSALELWQSLSSRPHQCLLQTPKAIAPRQATDLVLFTPEEKWVVNQDNLKSPAANTPWYNREIMGRVVKTWTR